MRAAVVSVGDEILRGIVLDTNSQWIAQRLAARGVEVVRMLTLPDRPDEVAEELSRLIDPSRGVRRLLRRAASYGKSGSTPRHPPLDLVAVTGGLGPTDDDRTVEAVAAALGRHLEERADVVATLEVFYDDLAAAGRIPTGGLDDARRRMARLPKDAEALPNPVGAAPGVWAPPVVVLPGVPSEMKAIWTGSVEPRLGSPRVIELSGVIDCDDESVLAPSVTAVARRHAGVYVKTRAKDFGGSGVMVTAFGPADQAAAALDDLAATSGHAWRRPYAPPE